MVAARSYNVGGVESAPIPTSFDESDPVKSLWLEWKSIHDQREVDGKILKIIETKLVEAAGGFRRVEIASLGIPTFVSSEAEIDRLLSTPEQIDEKERAKAALEVRQKAWEKADALVGYSEAYDEDTANSYMEIELADAVLATQATSLTGVAAKLHCLIEMENPGGCLAEGPWPQLQSILNDLIMLGNRQAT